MGLAQCFTLHSHTVQSTYPSLFLGLYPPRVIIKMPPLATIGILSIGEMGMGIAKLLIAHNYRVVTNLEGRSADTQARVKAASIDSLPDDTSLVTEADYILSIVPPRDAVATAKRITSAFSSQILASLLLRPQCHLPKHGSLGSNNDCNRD